MSEPGLATIEALGKRSNASVMKITLVFAMTGALLNIGGHLLRSLMTGQASFPMFWGMWIPLCYLVIPPVHYLCRMVIELQRRVDELEAQAKHRAAA